MTGQKTAKELSKSEKKVRRLYTLVWFLACPLVYVLASLLRFTQINIVYWTLLIVPILLGVYNVRQVPPVRGKAQTAIPAEGAGEDVLPEDEPESPAPEGISQVRRLQLIAIALKIPVIIAAPILITLLVDLVFRVQQ